MKWLHKVWPWLPLTRGDLLGGLLVVSVIVGLLAFNIWKPFMGRPSAYLASQPGWTCTFPPRGEPICVKDVKPAP